ncbi:MAG: frataxin domain-containing protein [Anaplasma sp.]
MVIEDNSALDLEALAKEALDALLSLIEGADEAGRVECDNYDGAVKAVCGESTYLISWHPTSSQIWVASPISGSMRFSYVADEGLWRNAKNGQELFSFVKREMREVFGLPEQ